MCTPTPTPTVISHQQQPQDQSRENVGVLSVGRCGAGTIIILLVQNFLLDNWFFKTKKNISNCFEQKGKDLLPQLPRL